MRQIEIRVSPNAEVTVEAKCVVGEECKTLTEGIERALGRVVDDKIKTEFYQQEVRDEEYSSQH